MPEFRSINEAVDAAAHRSGVDRPDIWAAVRARFGAVRGLSAEARGEVEVFLDEGFPRPATAAATERSSLVSDEMTVSEAQARRCWRGVTVSGNCEPGRCMAWRIVSVFDDEGEAAPLDKRGSEGHISLGRCLALPKMAD